MPGCRAQALFRVPYCLLVVVMGSESPGIHSMCHSEETSLCFKCQLSHTAPINVNHHCLVGLQEAMDKDIDVFFFRFSLPLSAFSVLRTLTYSVHEVQVKYSSMSTYFF